MSDKPLQTPSAQHQADQVDARRREDAAWAATEAAVNAPTLAKLLNPEHEQFLTTLVSNIRGIEKKSPDSVAWDVADLMAEASLLSAVVMFRVQEAARFVEASYSYLPLIQILDLFTKAMQIVTEELTIQAVQRKVLTRREAAASLNIHENTVARWVKEKAKLQQPWNPEPPSDWDKSKPWVTSRPRPDSRIFEMRSQIQEALHDAFPDFDRIVTWAAENNRVVLDELMRRLRASDR